MPADRRLTIETVRPGMKVVCVERELGTPLEEGRAYTIEDYLVMRNSITVAELPGWGFYPRYFSIPADPEPAPSWATEELRWALAGWFRYAAKPTSLSSPYYVALMEALENAPGLLPCAPASTTDRAASIDGEWFV